MAVFEEKEKPQKSETKTKKHEIARGLWVKCKACGEIIFSKELGANAKVCSKCDYHFTMTAPERIAMLADESTFREFDADMASVDMLKFTGVAAYSERLRTYQRQTDMNNAVSIGLGKLDAHDSSLALMDFSFLGARIG